MSIDENGEGKLCLISARLTVRRCRVVTERALDDAQAA